MTLCEVTGDGERAYFRTWGRLSPQDSDGQSGAFCAGASPNGRYVAFSTYEELVPGDGDVDSDIYVVDMGAPPRSGHPGRWADLGPIRPEIGPSAASASSGGRG